MDDGEVNRTSPEKRFLCKLNMNSNSKFDLVLIEGEEEELERRRRGTNWRGVGKKGRNKTFY